MSQYDISGLVAQIASLWNDNINEEITPVDDRAVAQHLIDSLPVKNDVAEISGQWEFTKIPIYPLPFGSDQDLTIAAAGVYVFYGSTARTWTINDGIRGEVIIRTLATDVLTLVGNINTDHSKEIYQGEPSTSFIWFPLLSLYTY